MRTSTLQVVDSCWGQIGVHGDRSCPELTKVIHCHNCSVFARAAQALLDRPPPDNYLVELTDFVAEPVIARKLPDQSAVLCSIGNEGFAVPTHAIVEMTQTRPPRRVPHRSNDVFAGLINIRGQLELCVSLHGMLGLPAFTESADGMWRVLLVSVAGERWGLCVDSVKGIHRYERSTMLDVPGSSQRRSSTYLTGVIDREGEHFGVLDVARVCAALQGSLA